MLYGPRPSFAPLKHGGEASPRRANLTTAGSSHITQNLQAAMEHGFWRGKRGLQNPGELATVAVESYHQVRAVMLFRTELTTC